MLSLTCKIAIKAVVYLASKFESGAKSSLKEVSAAIDSSEHTVGKILQLLVRQQVINSTKGPSGGFYITGEQLVQPIIRVVETIDGEEVFTQCGLGLSHCSASRPCPIHEDYKNVRDLFETLCRERKLIDLCSPVMEGFAYLAG